MQLFVIVKYIFLAVINFLWIFKSMIIKLLWYIKITAGFIVDVCLLYVLYRDSPWMETILLTVETVILTYFTIFTGDLRTSQPLDH